MLRLPERATTLANRKPKRSLPLREETVFVPASPDLAFFSSALLSAVFSLKNSALPATDSCEFRRKQLVNFMGAMEQLNYSKAHKS
jgi:hypothetical protein